MYIFFMIGCSYINNINALNTLNKYFARKKENFIWWFLEETDGKVYSASIFIKTLIDFPIFVICAEILLLVYGIF